MSGTKPLHGSCSCGRYEYVVLIPEDSAEQAQLNFLADTEHRRSTSALLSSYLRIPLPWYASRTVSFFPDESHHTISRTFTPQHQPHSRRKFCGYCGTHLSYWTEEPREEEGYLHVNVGSLNGKDLGLLEDLGLLDVVSEDEDEQTDTNVEPQPPVSDAHEMIRSQDETSLDTLRATRQGHTNGLTWFEEMLDGSRLGRKSKTRKGMGTSADGTTTVSWEVSEFYDGDTNAATEGGSKRKLADVADDDTKMA